jgi:hypothetical protein
MSLAGFGNRCFHLGNDPVAVLDGALQPGGGPVQFDKSGPFLPGLFGHPLSAPV